MDRPWVGRSGFDQLFRDRREAGGRLAEALRQYRGRDTLVLGIPRGGVLVAAEVARGLGAELDVVVACKLGAPGSPELAIGAVTAGGGVFLNEELVRELRVSSAYVAAAIAEETAEARRREERFRGPHPVARVTDRMVVVVDDGLATGATMRAAVRSLRPQQPARLIVAVPVGTREACATLREEADEVVCLYEPDPFYSVGLFYVQFEQTVEAEVQRILQEARVAHERPASQAS